jgi:uncharacterized membrane protein SirB2
MLLPLFEWFEASAAGQMVRTSLWLFPATEAVHLLGLCLLGGSLLVVDLRMLGWGLKRQSISELARATTPWLIASVVVLVTTGTALFLSEAIKCYYNQAFWLKMTTLPVALAYTLVVRRFLARQPALDTSARSRALAIGSLALWFTVAAAGRWIGFS